jgi:hypothetical protein
MEMNKLIGGWKRADGLKRAPLRSAEALGATDCYARHFAPLGPLRGCTVRHSRVMGEGL